MSDATTPIDVMRGLRWSLAAMAQAVGEPGSYEREQAKLMAEGIEARVDWCIKQLEAAKEGEKNMGAR